MNNVIARLGVVSSWLAQGLLPLFALEVTQRVLFANEMYAKLAYWPIGAAFLIWLDPFILIGRAHPLLWKPVPNYD